MRNSFLCLLATACTTAAARVLEPCPHATSEVVEFTGNKTYTLKSSDGGGVAWSGEHASASLEWPRIGHKAHVNVLSELISKQEAASLIDLLDDQKFDVDKDTVDRMTTYEFYLQKNGNIADVATIPGKPAHSATRRAVREQAVAMTQPIIDERIVPLVNELYPEDCHGECYPCFSFVRQYDPEHRTTHQAHLDIQALVTVVISLNSCGPDFEGGLYVSTGNSHDDTRYVALQSGDAVIHQSDLLHGVRINRGERWSWILWFYDGGPSCHADPATWFRGKADDGDPLAQFLLAKRAHMTGDGSGSSEQTGREWLEKSASGGFARAENDLAALYFDEATELEAKEQKMERIQKQFAVKSKVAAEVDVDGSVVEKPIKESVRLKQKAVDLYKSASEYEADAMYNVGRLALAEALEQAERKPGSAGEKFTKAVNLFAQAAAMGSNLAMFNLGVAHNNGAGVATGKDLEKAVHWFQCAETKEGMRRAAAIYRMDDVAMQNLTLSTQLYERAALMGDGIAQWQLIEDTHKAGNDFKAMDWLKVAVEHNQDAQAMYTLGRLILSNSGTAPGVRAQAEREAMEYLTHSAALGWKQAVEFLEKWKRDRSTA